MLFWRLRTVKSNGIPCLKYFGVLMNWTEYGVVAIWIPPLVASTVSPVTHTHTRYRANMKWWCQMRHTHTNCVNRPCRAKTLYLDVICLFPKWILLLDALEFFANIESMKSIKNSLSSLTTLVLSKIYRLTSSGIDMDKWTFNLARFYSSLKTEKSLLSTGKTAGLRIIN